MSFAGIPPNPTIYVNNLNEKLKKTELKRNLYLLSSQFGNVLDVHCTKSEKLRGQAWIVYDALSGATRALRELDGFNFFGKELKVSYAKSKSDITRKMEGTYKKQSKRKGTEKTTTTSTAVTTIPDKAEDKMEDEEEKHLQPAKKTKPDSGANRAREKVEDENEPNQILFVESLPKECTTLMLSILFQQYSGFKEARLVDGKPGIAFVEFADATQAGSAKESLQGFKITPTNLMKITYARQ